MSFPFRRTLLARRGKRVESVAMHMVGCDGFRRVALHGAVAAGLALLLGCGSPEEVVLGTGLPGSSFYAGDDAGLDAGPPGGRIVGFMLVDVTTATDVRPLFNGDTISRSAYPVTIRTIMDL